MTAAIDTTDFARYPPIAQAVATKQLALLRQLPVSFAALLLSGVISYDWRFPAEQADIDRQLHFLSGLTATQLHDTMAGFADLSLPDTMQQSRWAAAPAEFIEAMTAHLWTVHQMDRFREVATTYQHALSEAEPEPAPAIPRLCIVVIGKDAAPGAAMLFQKLRPYGTYFKNVAPQRGLDSLFKAVGERVRAHPSAYGHWYVDGGPSFLASSDPGHADGLVVFSYASLAPLRSALLQKVNTVRTSGEVVGPESLRSLLANLQPGELGTAGTSRDPVLRHFELSLLTEGSGTQIFSTTFVQWAGRELLRRARPLTLVLRYAPRQRDRPMNEMLRADVAVPQNDPAGSLIDADMGAYYTWINLMRLPGAEQARFVVWFEGQREALAVAPGMARGSVSDTSCDLTQILRWIS